MFEGKVLRQCKKTHGCPYPQAGSKPAKVLYSQPSLLNSNTLYNQVIGCIFGHVSVTQPNYKVQQVDKARSTFNSCSFTLNGPVKCSLGTYYNNATQTCRSCPVGFYQNDVGQPSCKPCPTIAGKQGVTSAPGARSAGQCKGELLSSNALWSSLHMSDALY